MDLLQTIRTFAQVVESGSFAAAARRLDMSNATVSRQIAYLESSIGGRLLNRTTRKLSLTEVGQACYDRYSRVLAELDGVREMAQAGTVIPQGTLRIASITLFWIHRIVPLLPEFQSRYPNVQVHINLIERIVDLIEEGYDLALQFVQPEAKTLVGRRIVPLHRTIYASAAYLRRHGIPNEPQELSRHNCLLYTQQLGEVVWEFTRGNDVQEVKVEGNLRTNDAMTVREAAIHGLGLARGPIFLVHDDLESGRLVRVLPDYDVTSLGLWAVYPSRLHLPAKVRVFIDYLDEKLTGDRTLTMPFNRKDKPQGRPGKR